MFKAKFTKGPWSIDVSQINNAPHCLVGYCNKDGELFEICGVYGVYSHEVECEQSTANAHLIEAAPDMYEFIETYMAGHPEAEKLLAKARGENV